MDNALIGYKNLVNIEICPFKRGFFVSASYGVCNGRKTIRIMYGNLRKIEFGGKKELCMNRWKFKDIRLGRKEEVK